MITSPRNPGVVAALALRTRSGRERARLFLAEGPGSVAEAIRMGVAREVFVAPTSPVVAAPSGVPGDGPRVVNVSTPLLRRLAATVTPQGPVAVCGFIDVPAATLRPSDGPIVVLIEVRDPGNLGTMLRTAHAAGSAGVIVSVRSVDVYNEKAIRASAGSVFHLPIVRDAEPAQALGFLKARGVSVLAAAADGDHDLYDEWIGALLVGPVALVFGNEAHGLEPAIRRAVDATVRVPMAAGMESLSVAAAAAVMLFEAARRRRAGPRDRSEGGRQRSLAG